MNLALFDFDGTITFGDTFTPFLYFAVDPRRIALGRVALAPMFVCWKLRLLSDSQARERAAGFGFRGCGEADVRALGASYARDVLPGVVRPEAQERIRWHKAQGDRVVVVSASLDLYLVPWCHALDLELICTEMDTHDGRYTGRYRGGDCLGPEKPRRILERYNLRDYSTVYAYGDTIEDHPMLRLATKRFFQWREMTS